MFETNKNVINEVHFYSFRKNTKIGLISFWQKAFCVQDTHAHTKQANGIAICNKNNTSAIEI